MSLKFKTNRERDEYVQLPLKNKNLFDLVVDLSHYIDTMLKKDMVLTSVYRSEADQAALYSASQVKVKNSAHSSWEAVDLRSSIYTEDEIRGIVNYLNSQYKNANGKPVVLYHAIAGNVPHFHIQMFRS